MRTIPFKLKASETTLRYNQSAHCFNNALPLGNGRIGAMVYGGVREEKISINEDTLWSGYPKQKSKQDFSPVYQKARELTFENKTKDAQRLLEENFGDSLVQMYLPLADIIIKTNHLDETRYSRVLKLDTAVHTVKYTVEDTTYTRETFVSEPSQVLASRFSSSKKGSLSFEIKLDGRLKSDTSVNRDMLLLSGTAPYYDMPYGESYNPQRIYDGKGISYLAALCVEATGGTVRYGKKSIEVKNADEAVIYFAVRNNFKGFNQMPSGEEYREKCLEDIKNASKLGFEDLKKLSVEDHKSLYNRCVISLSDGSDIRMSTDKRLERLKAGGEDNALYALLFNFAKYLTIASSRKGTQPTNLQGIWNDKIMPPWSSNYTLNINTEMNYWPTLSMGLFECYEPLIKMVEELSCSGESTAKRHYGVNGWCSHHASDLWCTTHPSMNGYKNSCQWGFWSLSSGWLSVMLWNYYRFTRDREYLKKIYPIISKSARFYKELLIEYDGELIFSPSTSPENNYIENGEMLPLDKSAAMSQQIIKDLFSSLVSAQEILGIDSSEYSHIIKKLRGTLIQSDGQICEWHNEHEVWDTHHRHVSHLYGLFPANLFDERQKAAAKKVLLSRGDSGTGWSLAWKINLWARLGDGNHALNLIKNQLSPISPDYEGSSIPGGSYPNLFCAHPPFQIDGNFGAASGIIEMLVQCDNDGNVTLLPALPSSWKCGSVRNLCLPNGKKVSFSWENGEIIKSRIKEK